jgi:hypothetical protein
MSAKNLKRVEEIRAIVLECPEAVDYLSPFQRALCHALMGDRETTTKEGKALRGPSSP